jgi:hypothetical protein
MNNLKYFNEYHNLNESVEIGQEFLEYIMSIENLGQLIINDLFKGNNCKIINKDVNDLTADVDDESSTLDQNYTLDLTFTYNYNGKEIPLILYSEGNVLFYDGTLDKDTNDVPGIGWKFSGNEINIETFEIMLNSEFDSKIDTSKVDNKIKEKLIDKLIPWI